MPLKQQKKTIGAKRQFPLKCHHCYEQKVELATINYDAEVRYENQLHQFNIPKLDIPICQACGEKVFTEKVDAQVNIALRAYLNLLTPTQISKSIKRIGMHREDVAKRLGVPEKRLAYWIDEVQIQPRAMDNLLRLFFGMPTVRAVLCGDKQNSELGLSDELFEEKREESTKSKQREHRSITLDD